MLYAICINYIRVKTIISYLLFLKYAFIKVYIKAFFSIFKLKIK